MHKKPLFTGGALLAPSSSTQRVRRRRRRPLHLPEELDVPAIKHTVLAAQPGLHLPSCVDFEGAGIITESGYFWNSSFQDVDSVVDSQINDFQANGYHLYAKYSFQAEQCSEQETCNGDTRLNYTVTGGSLLALGRPRFQHHAVARELRRGGGRPDRRRPPARAPRPWSSPARRRRRTTRRTATSTIVFGDWAVHGRRPGALLRRGQREPARGGRAWSSTRTSRGCRVR